MRKVSGTASSAFRAIWGDLEDQAELSVESGIEQKPNTIKDSYGTPGGKENRKGIHTEEKTSAIFSSPRQFNEEDPTESGLKIFGTNLNQSKNSGQKSPPAPTKNIENSPHTPSPTIITLPIRSRNNSQNSKDLKKHDSDSPVPSQNKLPENNHLPGLNTGPNENIDEEARSIQEPNGLDEIQCQAARKILKNGSESNLRVAEIEADACNKYVPRDHRTEVSKDSSPINFFKENTPNNLLKGSSDPSPKFPEDTPTKNGNNSLYDLVPKKNPEFEASEKICTEDTYKTSSKIHSQEEKQDNSFIDLSGSNNLKNSVKNLANVELTTIGSNTILELECKDNTDYARLRGVDNIPYTGENNFEVCQATTNPMDRDMKVKCNDSINVSENETVANSQVTENYAELCLPDRKDQIRNFAFNFSEQMPQLVDSKNFTVKNVHYKITSDPDRQPVITDFKITRNVDKTDAVGQEDLEEVETVENETTYNISNDYYESVIAEIKAQEHKIQTHHDAKESPCESIRIEIKEPEAENRSGVVGQDLKEVETVESESAHDPANDSCESISIEIKEPGYEIQTQNATNKSTCESINVEMKAPETKNKSDEKEKQDLEVRNFVIRPVTEEDKNNSPCELITTETKAPKDEIQSRSVEQQDLEEINTVDNGTILDGASDSCESIITVVKAQEQEIQTLNATNESPCEPIIVVEQDSEEINTIEKKIAHDSADDSCESISIEIKEPEYEIQTQNATNKSTCESTNVEMKAPETKNKSDEKEKQDLEVRNFVIRPVTEEDKNNSPCELITTETKAPKDEIQSRSVEQQDLEEINTVDNGTILDGASDSCESIITVVKAQEQEIQTLNATNESSCEPIIVVEQDSEEINTVENEIAHEAASDSRDSIITEIKVLEDENRSSLVKQDSEEINTVDNGTTHDGTSDSCESIITVVKAQKQEIQTLNATNESPCEPIFVVEQDSEEINTVENKIAHEAASDSRDSIITEIKVLEDDSRIYGEEDQNPEEKNLMAKETVGGNRSNSLCDLSSTEIKQTEYEIQSGVVEHHDLKEKDAAENETTHYAASDSCESIITGIKAPESENRLDAIKKQDLEVTKSVAKSVTEENKSDSLCESIITERMIPKTKTPNYEPQISSKEDKDLNSTNRFANHGPHGDYEAISSTMELYKSAEKEAERNFHETGIDDFKRVVNSRLLIGNASEKSPAMHSNQDLKSKNNNSDVSSENDNSFEKSTDKKNHDKRAKFTSIAAFESRISILSLGSSKENSIDRSVTIGAKNKLATHTSKFKQTSNKNNYNASDNGSITTTKVKKSLKEKIMGKISGKLHKVRN